MSLKELEGAGVSVTQVNKTKGKGACKGGKFSNLRDVIYECPL